MIALHRPDGTEFFLNVAHIVSIETTPDTIVTLFSGEKLRIKEHARDVADTITVLFQRVATPTVVTLPPLRGTLPDDDKDD